MLKEIQIQRILGRRKTANLIFASNEEIQARIGRKASSLQDKAVLMSELLLRRYLNPRSIENQFIDHYLTNGERGEMDARLNSTFVRSEQDAETPFWAGQDRFSSVCEQEIRRRLYLLLSPDKTAGFIPVYLQGKSEADTNAFFLPFHFEEGIGIVDLDGAEIAEWGPYYSLPARCVVHCYQSSIPTRLTGNSFMFPVALAWQRRQDSFPKYDILRLIATGAIEENHLIPVAVGEKTEGAKAMFSNAFFLFPESKDYFSDRGTEIPLSTTMPMDEIMEKARRIIEANSLHIPDFTYAMSRLKQIQFETCHEGHHDWTQLLNIVKDHAKAVNQFLNPEAYLLYLMLQSAICCHMGKTHEALKYNKKAKDFAKENDDFQKILLRLEIEEFVDLQDMDDFEQIRDLYRELGEAVEKTKDPDLLMRFYGTMGQAHVYGTLAGIDGFSKENAKTYFEKAVKQACKISNEDAAQDLNYLHLWHAVFMPGTEEEQEAYEQAKNHINQYLSEKSQKVFQKNCQFLTRQKNFAYYRKLLLDQTTPPVEDLKPLEKDTAPWLLAVNNKYCGAVLAASGKREEAIDLFNSALTALPEKEDEPVLTLIRMTIQAEAWRSTGIELYRTGALEASKRLEKEYPAMIPAWRSFLQGKGAFPGLQFWY